MSKRGIVNICSLLIGSFLLVDCAAAQETPSRTHERLNALHRQIQSLEQQRRRTVQREEATLETLQQTNREIKVRQALIATYRRRIGQLEAESDSLRQSVDRLENRLAVLKDEYQSRLVHLYKYGRLHDLALILSAESINQMFIRIKYLHQFALQREEMGRAIQQTTDELVDQQTGLKETISDNRRLLAESRQERQELLQLKQDRARLVEQLRRRENEIEEKLAQKRRDARRLEARLRALLSSDAERRREAGRAAEAAARALTGSFMEQKGMLPWPAQGVVTEDYGTQVHEVYGTKTINPGIIIKTRPGEAVHAVFEGTVAKVLIMAGYGSCAIIRHGDYMSVYCNLSSLYVREGDYVTTGQRIAHAGTSSQPLGAALFFGLFTGEGHIDPQPWLR